MPLPLKLEASRSGMLYQIGKDIQTKPRSVCPWLAGPNSYPSPKPELVCTHKEEKTKDESTIEEEGIIYEDDDEECVE